MTPVERVRAICLALPEAVEKETWDAPTFRVRDKIFALLRTRDGGGTLSVCCKAPTGTQELLLQAAPERFFAPRYVGHRGWIGIRLDDGAPWDEVAHRIEQSWRMTAPKRLLRASPPAGQSDTAHGTE